MEIEPKFQVETKIVDCLKNNAFPPLFFFLFKILFLF